MMEKVLKGDKPRVSEVLSCRGPDGVERGMPEFKTGIVSTDFGYSDHRHGWICIIFLPYYHLLGEFYSFLGNQTHSFCTQMVPNTEELSTLAIYY